MYPPHFPCCFNNMFNVIITDHGCSDSGLGNPVSAIRGVVLPALRAQVGTTQESHIPQPFLEPGRVTHVRHHLIHLPHFTDGKLRPNGPVSLCYSELAATQR